MLYRLDRPIMVLATKDNHQAAVPIPTGKIVGVAGSSDDDRFVLVGFYGRADVMPVERESLQFELALIIGSGRERCARAGRNTASVLRISWAWKE